MTQPTPVPAEAIEAAIEVVPDETLIAILRENWYAPDRTEHAIRRDIADNRFFVRIARAAYAAGVEAGRDQAMAGAECMATLLDLALNPDHHACPCRKTGQHRIHRCEHGTEWWSVAGPEQGGQS